MHVSCNQGQHIDIVSGGVEMRDVGPLFRYKIFSHSCLQFTCYYILYPNFTKLYLVIEREKSFIIFLAL